MGWSSWYCMSGGVSDAWVREAADALLSTGLADHGWNYVNLDDFWMTRDGRPLRTVRIFRCVNQLKPFPFANRSLPR